MITHLLQQHTLRFLHYTQAEHERQYLFLRFLLLSLTMRNFPITLLYILKYVKCIGYLHLLFKLKFYLW